MPKSRVAAVSVALVLAALAGCSRDCRPSMSGGWVRLVPGDQGMLAGYGRVGNACSDDIVIVGASSPQFQDVSLHRSMMVDGVSRMRAVPALTVPSGGSVELEPGGLHLMLMQPTVPLRGGDRVAVAFTLQDGSVLPATLEVRQP